MTDFVPTETEPLLEVHGLTRRFGALAACDRVDLSLWPGEVLGIVGESGSGKTTLLETIGGRQPATAGQILYRTAGGAAVDILALPEIDRRRLLRDEWGYVQQHAHRALRMGVSAGANIGEPLMAGGARRYAAIRGTALDWLRQVEIDAERVDDPPKQFSGGMRQRLQLARTLVTHPRLVLMDEPTGGLDVSGQARLLDLLRRLVREHGLSAIVVTHDFGVARLLADRLMVMRRGRIVEEGLTDQLLDDPQHPYTQLLVSSVLSV